MKRRGFTFYDYGVQFLGLTFTLLFLMAADRRNWSLSTTIAGLILASIPVAFGLFWLRMRLRSRFRNSG